VAKQPIDYVSLKPADFLTDADVRSWPAREVGAYCLLIFFLYKNHGKANSDPRALCRICQCQESEWSEVWSTIAQKFSEREHVLTHKRVSLELRKARKRMEKAKRAGVIGAKARWQPHSNRNANAIAKLSNVMVSKEDTPPTPSEGEWLLGCQLPSSLDTPEFGEAWRDWFDYRKGIRHALTPKTIERQLAKLARDPSTAVAVIEQSIENGWQGLFEVKDGRRGKTGLGKDGGAVEGKVRFDGGDSVVA